MNEQNYTSQELSKWLHDNGCTLESDNAWDLKRQRLFRINELDGDTKLMGCVCAFDILNDICCKYTREFFGNDVGSFMKTFAVFKALQQYKKVEAEKYIKTHCLFNPTNK